LRFEVDEKGKLHCVSEDGRKLDIVTFASIEEEPKVEKIPLDEISIVL
jgi:hypothetical protein